MKLNLSPEEFTALKEGLDAYLPELERETVRADVHAMQHALNLRWQALSEVRARLDQLTGEEEIGDSESPMAGRIIGSMDQPGI